MSSDLDFFMFPKRVYVAGIPKAKPTANKVETLEKVRETENNNSFKRAHWHFEIMDK